MIEERLGGGRDSIGLYHGDLTWLYVNDALWRMFYTNIP